MTRVTRVNWRTAAAALPAVALVGSGLALAVTDGHRSTDTVAGSSPVVTVPETAVQHPESPTLPALPELPAPPETSATQVARVAGSPLAGSANGIPAAALAAYRRGAQLVDAADPGCNLDWALLAAIGKVESDHGRYGGNGVDAQGTVRPGIYGIALDGTHDTAVIRDTDGGAFDRDATHDRAMGPMQFIPGTWRTVGVDANGDGRKDPQNLMDAATAAAVYLCSGPGDLGTASGARTAVLRYNHSDAYADQVLAIARAYRGGYAVVPDSGLTEAQRTGRPYLPTGDEVQPGSGPGVVAAGQPSRPEPGARGTTPSPSMSGSSPTGSGAGSGPSGTSSGGPGAGGPGSGGPGSGDNPTPAPSGTAGGGLGGTVGGVVGVVGGAGQSPSSSSTSSRPSPISTSSSTSVPRPTPSSSTTAPLPLEVLPLDGTCPTGYDPVVELGATVLCVRR